MDIFGVLNMVCGLALFLYGMHIMGEGLTRMSGGKLESILEKLTNNKMKAVLLGALVTAVIQSSSATTVMVVGFVNSGIMKLTQAAGVIMGANIGTTITSWILSLTGLEGSSMLVRLFKPSSFTPVMAIIGVAFIMFAKSEKKGFAGQILVGFTILMNGMDMMSAAVKPLANVPEFTNILLMFTNPVLGMLAGMALTAVIQSSSASVGILQALATTGAVSVGAAIPIIMGQNIGTCITAILSSVGTNKNARRTALVHLSFNVIGTIVWLTLFCILKAVLSGGENFFTNLIGLQATQANIAIAHSTFNIACTLLLLPMSGLLEKLAYILVPEGKQPEQVAELDELLLATPFVALERARSLTVDMADCAALAIDASLKALDGVDTKTAENIRAWEDKTDHYEDVLGSYLVKLSANVGAENAAEAAMLLKAIGDFERIGDHASSILKAAEEMKHKEIRFTEPAQKEITVLRDAVKEIIGLACKAFSENDMEAAMKVEPLEQVVDRIKEQLRRRHIERLQQGTCTIEAGFVWADLLTDLGRVSDHCSNIAGGVIDLQQQTMNIHEAQRTMKSESEEYKELYRAYKAKYLQNV